MQKNGRSARAYLVGGAAEPGVPDGAAVPEQALHAELAAAAVLLLQLLSVVAADDAHGGAHLPGVLAVADVRRHDGVLRLLARHHRPSRRGPPFVPQLAARTATEPRSAGSARVLLQKHTRS